MSRIVCTERQARAIVSSWAAQGRVESSWVDQGGLKPVASRPGVNTALIDVRFLMTLVDSHSLLYPVTSQTKGLLRGAPKKQP